MAKTIRYQPDLSFETDAVATHGAPVAGVDEAGRGPLAGPVVAAAVILDLDAIPDGLDDSKALSAVRREELYDVIAETSVWAVGIVEPAEIDSINILQATMKSMGLAVDGLVQTPCMCLIDGNRIPDLPYSAKAIVKGDSRSLSIAAASIIAKVTRDRIMRDLDVAFPGYAWAQNMGYGTRAHKDALARLGPTPHHRRSFAPVRAAMNAV